jgi:hypothetical protein
MNSTQTIFFSWQADTDTKTGRNLLERVLERAVGRIGSDVTIDEAVRDLELDRDTQGAPGFPPIVDTIFRKIDQAAVFVPDLTFVGKRLDGRPTPNPNVLIEYGWALRSLTHGRIVPVVNAYYGEPTAENMPFDMRHLRFPITYNCAPDADEITVKRVKAELGKEVERAIRGVLNSDEYRSRIQQSSEPAPFIGRASDGGSEGRFAPRDIPLGIRDGRSSAMEVSLIDKPVMWLRVMPTLDPGKSWGVADLREIATYQTSHLIPHTRRWASLDYLRRSDGFGVYATTNANVRETPAIVVAFTSGEIWSVDASYLEEMKEYKQIPAAAPSYPDALKQYANFLSKLGIAPPYRWIAGMEDLIGRGVADPISPVRAPIGPCVNDVIVCEGLYTPGESSELALRPFFTRLFDACGTVYSVANEKK